VLNTFNFASILSLSIVIFFHIIYFVTIKNKKEVTNLFILSVVPIVLFFTMNGKVLDAKFNNNLSLSTSDQVISSVLNNKESNKLLLDKEVVSKYLSDNKLVLLFDRSDRLSMWLVALKNFGDNPVFGLGFGSYIHIGFQLDYLEGGPIYSYPHNPFLELASQAGLIGLIIFSILVAYSFILIFRTYRLSSVSIDFVFVLCFFFLVSQFGGDLYDFRYFWIMSLIGVLTSHLYERNSK
jgi:O-antigen ligase